MKKINDNIIKESNYNAINVEVDLENKSVDDIMNYINIGNKGKKSNKKISKKKRKKVKKYSENNINNNNNISNNNSNKDEIKKEDNEDEEDQIVLQFKRNLGENLIFANFIHKIKPNISEKWIKIISEKY